MFKSYGLGESRCTLRLLENNEKVVNKAHIELGTWKSNTKVTRELQILNKMKIEPQLTWVVVAMVLIVLTFPTHLITKLNFGRAGLPVLPAIQLVACLAAKAG